MLPLNAVITKEGEFFIATAPDFGVQSSGKTLNEALAKLHLEAQRVLEEMGLTDCYTAS